MRLIVLLVGILMAAAVRGQPIPWRGENFFISSRSIPVADVLKSLGANYGIPVVVSGKISGKFAGELEDRPRGAVLAELARLYQLIPYYDGHSLYVYKAQEVEQLSITPAYVKAGDIIRLVAQAGLTDGVACRVSDSGSASAFQVTGVPICLSRVASLAKQLDDQYQTQEQTREDVAIYPLKYANAADTNYGYRGQTVVIPGVASVLREMSQSRTLSMAGGKPAAAVDPGGLPTFAADTRQNAVLVRDFKRNMGLYEELIPKLDQRPTLVNISVAIIDVDAADINELGIDWSASASIGGVGVSFNQGSGLAADNFSSLVFNTNDFMVRLSALEQQSKAKIVSRPSVVTLDNVQAILDRNVTFYTKLVSEKNAQLETVTAGALMRVTPRLIREGANEKVLLTLNIQDGRQGAAFSKAEPLPQVQTAEIATQATLNPGQALLLGGFVEDEHTEGERKIPLLGDIPVLGNLFRSNSRSSRSVVRLFLIKAEPTSLG